MSRAGVILQFEPIGRREFLALIGAGVVGGACASAGMAQQPRMLRVGYVGLQPRNAPIYGSFVKRMAELGYQEGRNFAFEYTQISNIEGYEAAYRELVARKVDILVTAGNEPGLRGARAAAGNLPVAFLAIDYDPLAKGFVASLSRPGGNLTGILVRQIELSGKRVELIREVLPNARRIGIAWDQASQEQADAAEAAAHALGFEPRLIELNGQAPDYPAAFGRMDDAPGQPVVIPASPIFLRDHESIARILLERRIPSISAFRENAEAGVLMSYGIDLIGLFGDIADYVDRIARGAKPADMPIENSTRYHMTVNLKTAKALGIALSDAIAARAHEVFE